MGHFYFLLGLGALVLLAFIFSLHKRFGHRQRFPYVVDEALFSPEQHAFLAVLERALGQDYRVYGRVRAADVIGLRRRPRLDKDGRRRAWARLGDRQFDFLICATRDSAIACAVNLIPRSRLRRRLPRDPLDQVCAAAGLPFVRLRGGDEHAVAQVRERVFTAMLSRRKPAHQVAEAPPREVPPEDREVLRSLSEMMVDDDREPRLHAVQAPVPGAVRPPGRAPAAAALPAASVAPRVEPTLAGDGDVDPGPAFSFDGDLDEDERPLRVRRS